MLSVQKQSLQKTKTVGLLTSDLPVPVDPKMTTRGSMFRLKERKAEKLRRKRKRSVIDNAQDSAVNVVLRGASLCNLCTLRGCG